jgi:phage shock protein A
MFRTLAALAALSIGLAGTCSNSASGQASRSTSAQSVQTHLDKQATLLRRQVAQLTGDLRERSQRSDYRRLYRESTEMFYLADHIHELMHDQLDIAHLSEDVEDFDRAFHRVETMAGDLDGDSHRGGAGGVHRHDHNLTGQLEEIEDTLHHLRDDLAQLQRRPTRQVTPPPPRPGISIGGGRVRLQFNE